MLPILDYLVKEPSQEQNAVQSAHSSLHRRVSSRSRWTDAAKGIRQAHWHPQRHQSTAASAKGGQRNAPAKGIDIVVATPGRLLDFMGEGRDSTSSQVDILVLDEADRMFDMGFIKDIRKIVAARPGGSGRRCCSLATMPPRL